MATENSNFYLDAEFDQAEAGRDAAAAKIERLLRTSFEDGDRAVKACNGLRISHGIDGLIQKLNSDGLFGRRWHFGAMKGDFLVKGSREQAREALGQLPDAIRTHQALADICSDLQIAKREAAERRDRERLARQSMFAEHAPTRERGRN
ncbi:hypothetical protein ELG79_36500 [Rhizobium leguminosarum]|uniref:hypothetical protein n=1 Tax=Rhizobium leguminosarum TaxID=384 RepID=UPI0010309A7E|nr:hypothetical protein [Rhizobium leguminosarum]TBG08424.1 hypothetical protein ELG79_36500 [Rhizobium leguminosarum]